MSQHTLDHELIVHFLFQILAAFKVWICCIFLYVFWVCFPCTLFPHDIDTNQSLITFVHMLLRMNRSEWQLWHTTQKKLPQTCRWWKNFQFTRVMSPKFICQGVCILISVSFILVEPGTKSAICQMYLGSTPLLPGHRAWMRSYKVVISAHCKNVPTLHESGQQKGESHYAPTNILILEQGWSVPKLTAWQLGNIEC